MGALVVAGVVEHATGDIEDVDPRVVVAPVNVVEFVTEAVHQQGAVVANLLDGGAHVEEEALLRELDQVVDVGEQRPYHLDAVRSAGVKERTVVLAGIADLVLTLVVYEGEVVGGVYVVYADGVDTHGSHLGQVAQPERREPAASGDRVGEARVGVAVEEIRVVAGGGILGRGGKVLMRAT
eukprot:Mycagemm_TRINITY_DN10296_c0_g3::TRINITY_DN10296_c0_g3_i3::g.4340::m.4340 type:complete len:181 gc:universal TRINITY_DN10296_c0_g3_i3:1072-1614(+)